MLRFGSCYWTAYHINRENMLIMGDGQFAAHARGAVDQYDHHSKMTHRQNHNVASLLVRLAPC